MNASYDSYRVFYYAAKYHGFTQAANMLGGNQPNVTRTIKNLEASLGCKLFVRSNHGARLTPEGERLFAHISLAVGHIQAGEAELAADQGLQSGVVTIAASEIALHCCLLPALKAYRARYPGVRIRVSNHSTPQAINVLKDGLADFAVVTMPQHPPKALRRYPLTEVREVPVAGAAFSDLRGKTLSLEELARRPLIGLGPHTATFEFYSQLFSQRGITFQPDIEAATTDQILPMVKGDLGVGFVPEAFAQDEILQGTVFALSLDVPIPKRPVCLMKQEGRPLSIAAKEFERMIRAGNPPALRQAGDSSL